MTFRDTIRAAFYVSHRLTACSLMSKEQESKFKETGFKGSLCDKGRQVSGNSLAEIYWQSWDILQVYGEGKTSIKISLQQGMLLELGSNGYHDLIYLLLLLHITLFCRVDISCLSGSQSQDDNTDSFNSLKVLKESVWTLMSELIPALKGTCCCYLEWFSGTNIPSQMMRKETWVTERLEVDDQ